MWIKALYNTFLLPPGIIIVLLCIISFLNYRKQNKKLCYAIVLVTACLYLFSTPFVGGVLIHSLESRYNPPSDINGDVIVMLGYGVIPNTPNIDGPGHLSGPAANRALTTLRLYRLTGLPVILSGGQVSKYDGNEAHITKNILMGLGIPETKIINEDRSKNTKENARFTKQLLDQYGFTKPVLVVSAFQMKRAVDNFNGLNVNVIPYPTDFKTSRQPKISAFGLVPTYDGLQSSGTAIREYLGIMELKFTRYMNRR